MSHEICTRDAARFSNPVGLPLLAWIGLTEVPNSTLPTCVLKFRVWQNYFFTFLKLFDLFLRWNSVESSTISLDSSFHSCFRAYPVNSAKGFIWEVDSSSDYMARLLPYTPPRTAHYAHCTSNLDRKICSKMLFERRQPTSQWKKLFFWSMSLKKDGHCH